MKKLSCVCNQIKAIAFEQVILSKDRAPGVQLCFPSKGRAIQAGVANDEISEIAIHAQIPGLRLGCASACKGPDLHALQVKLQ
jgi:hypothetical protein